MIRTRAASTVLLADGDALGARGGEPCADKLDHLLKAQAVRDHERLAKAAPLPALKPLERVKGIEPSSSAWKSFGRPVCIRPFLTNPLHFALLMSKVNLTLSECPQLPSAGQHRNTKAPAD